MEYSHIPGMRMHLPEVLLSASASFKRSFALSVCCRNSVVIVHQRNQDLLLRGCRFAGDFQIYMGFNAVSPGLTQAAVIRFGVHRQRYRRIAFRRIQRANLYGDIVADQRKVFSVDPSLYRLTISSEAVYRIQVFLSTYCSSTAAFRPSALVISWISV